MSKIQFNQLNQNASEFTALNNDETAEVVGGYYGYYGSYFSYSDSYSVDIKEAFVNQNNLNSNSQFALGGGKKYSSNGNNNGTSQNNNANISQ